MNVYQKNTILLLVLVACFGLTIGYGYGFKNKIRQPELPAKYLHYQPMDSGLNTPNFELVPVLDGLANEVVFEAPIHVGKGVLIHVKSLEYSKTYRSIYYRMDSTGNLTDSLVYRNEFPSALVHGYLMHKDHYYSWPLNGDTTKQAYLPINSNLKWSGREMLDNFFVLNAKAEASEFIKYDAIWKADEPQYKLGIDQVRFLIKGKWYAFFGAGLYAYRVVEKDDAVLADQLHAHQVLGKGDPNFELAYFHKTSRYLSKPTDWHGIGFVDLIFKHTGNIPADTLKIKAEMSLQENVHQKTSTVNYTDIKLYGRPALNYSLLTVGNRKYYVIRNKRKSP